MKISLIAIPLVFGATALAQYTPGSRPHSYTVGNVLHPGGVPPQQPAGAPIAPMGGYGQPHSGGAGRGQGRANAPHPSHARNAIVPVYFGGFYYEPAIDQGPRAQEPPIVITNQDYRPEALNPVLRDYSNAPLMESPSLEQRQSDPPPAVIQQADPAPTIYLIALNDGTIVAALGFWMDGDTLNYITRDGNRNRISIDRVDRPFSIKLNADRKLEFKLE